MARRDVEDISLIQVDRLGSSFPRHLKQRLEMLVGSTAPHSEIGLDCRAAQMPVEDRSGRFQLHAGVARMQQLRQLLIALGDSFANRVLRPSGGLGLPPALPLVPGTHRPRSSRGMKLISCRLFVPPQL